MSYTLFLGVSNQNISLNDTITFSLFNSNPVNTEGQGHYSWTLYTSNGTAIASSNQGPISINFTSSSELYTQLVTNGITEYYAEDENGVKSEFLYLNYFDNSNFTSFNVTNPAPLIGYESNNPMIVSGQLNSSAPETEIISGSETINPGIEPGMFFEFSIIPSSSNSNPQVIGFVNKATGEAYASYIVQVLDSFYYFIEVYPINNSHIMYIGTNGPINISINYNGTTYSIYSLGYFPYSNETTKSESQSVQFNSFEYSIPTTITTPYTFIGTTAESNTSSYESTLETQLITVDGPNKNFIIYDGNSHSITFNSDYTFSVTLNGNTIAENVTSYTATQTEPGEYIYVATSSSSSSMLSSTKYQMIIYVPSGIFSPGYQINWSSLSCVFPSTNTDKYIRIPVNGYNNAIYNTEFGLSTGSVGCNYYVFTNMNGVNEWESTYVEYKTNYGDFGVLLDALTGENSILIYAGQYQSQQGINFSNVISISSVVNPSFTYYGPTMQLNTINQNLPTYKKIMEHEFFGYSQGAKTFNNINGKRNIFAGKSEYYYSTTLINYSTSKSDYQDIYSNYFVQLFNLVGTPAKININSNSPPTSNFYFTDKNGNQLKSWAETSGSGSDIFVYVLCPPFDSSNLQEIEMHITGEQEMNPKYNGIAITNFNSDNYAQYDNGSDIFDYYVNYFSGNTAQILTNNPPNSTISGYGLNLEYTNANFLPGDYIGVEFSGNSLYPNSINPPSFAYEINYSTSVPLSTYEFTLEIGFIQSSTNDSYSPTNSGQFLENYFGLYYTYNNDENSYYGIINQTKYSMQIMSNQQPNENPSNPNDFSFNGIVYQYVPEQLNGAYVSALNNELTNGSIWNISYINNSYLFPVFLIYNNGGTTASSSFTIKINYIKVYKIYSIDSY